MGALKELQLAKQRGLLEHNQYEQRVLEIGYDLACKPNRVLREARNARTPSEAKQGRRTMGMFITEDFKRKYSDRVVASTALMLENVRQHIESLDETTRTLHIGDFDKYAFPIVRAVFPNLIAQEIVSVQPMLGPTSLIFYMKFIRALSKGSARAGENIHENHNTYFGSEKIDAFLLANNGGGARFTGTVGAGTQLSPGPVKPGSFRSSTVDAGGNVLTVYDDGNGNIRGDVGAGAATRTIVYETGGYDFDFSAAPAVVGAVYGSFLYDAEGNSQMGEIDMTISSEPVVAEQYKLRTKYSIEAAQDLRSQHGLDADTELTAALANEIRFEIDRLILGDIRRGAATPGVTFPLRPPSGVDWSQYKLNFIDALVKSSNNILATTQRAKGTWIVGGIEVATLVESLPNFKASGGLTGRGVWKIGRLNNRWDVYCDTFAPDHDFTIGYKGESMFETGYVLAPYVLLYTTPTVALDDFQVRKGIASRFGRKFVDARFYTNNAIAPLAQATGAPIGGGV